MPPLFAALMLVPSQAVPAGAEQTATIFSTIGHSEWCPAGNVQLDLRTGDYVLTARAPRPICHDADLERPREKGRLDQARLLAVRESYRRVQAEGVSQCRAGCGEAVVISNGGTPILVLTNGVGTVAAPDYLGCWSRAASDLHHALDEAFRSSNLR